jgi:hypothetical protein
MTTMRPTWAARGVVLLLLLSLAPAGAVLLPAAPARAAESDLQVRLVDFPSWAGEADTLRVVLEVTNKTSEPATGLKARISFFQAATSRSDLEARLAGHRRAKNDPQAHDTLDLEDTVPPGETRTVAFSKALSEVSFLPTGENRVYPVRISLSGSGVEAPPISVPLVYFSSESPLPVGLALVIPLHVPAIYDENGLVVPGRVRRQIGDGRISRILDGLQSYPDVPVTIAPSALLLDTLADLADGYTAATGSGPVGVEPSDPTAVGAATLLDRIRGLAARPQTRTVVLPYSGARLTRLVGAGLTDRAEAQVVRARSRLRTLLGIDPLPGWVLPTDGELDSPTLAALVGSSGLSKTIVSSTSLSPPAESKLTAGAGVTLSTRDGHAVPALVQDAGLGRRLVPEEGRAASETRLRFLSEAATLMLEQPGRRRAVVAAAPLDWAPGDATVGGILDALARSPWMRGTTPDRILADTELPKPSVARIRANAAALGAAGSAEPSADYFTSLRVAKRMVDQYADLAPPPERLGRVETNLLIAESSDWWTGRPAIKRATRYARAVERIVRGEFAKVRAPESQRITLTSHRGVIPIQVQSEVDYPIDVVLRLDSDKLAFPDGMRLRRRLPPRGQSIEVRAIARTTGTFPVRVVLETPGQGVVLGSSQLVVRSTAYNVVGLIITGGAFIFLVTWWIVGVVRRRMARAQPAEAPA